jgi:hypothetical protein
MRVVRVVYKVVALMLLVWPAAAGDVTVFVHITQTAHQKGGRPHDL